MGMKLLFNIDSNDQPFLDRALLRDICQQIGDKQVALIATVGGFREGKSFFDNILLSALQKGGRAHFEANEIIGGSNGVPFKRGNQRHTVGIQVWDKVFYRRDSTGKEMAVLLLDTQGMFDTESPVKHSTIICMISLMISSHFVFNKMKRLNAHDLADLNVFIEMSKNGQEKIGQNLLFLMRDWQGDGNGGLTPEYLTQLRGSSEKATDLKEMLNGVFHAFHQVECWTVLPPGGSVVKADGWIKAGDCDVDFLESLSSCADHILGNLKAKKVLGTPLNGTALETYVQQIIEHVRENSVRCVNDALEATIRLCFQEAKERMMQQFHADIQAIKKQYGSKPIAEAELKTRLAQIRENSLKLYESRPLFGSSASKMAHRTELEKEVEKSCKELIDSNGERVRQQMESEKQQRRIEELRVENEKQQQRVEEARQKQIQEQRLREQAERARQEEQQRREQAERERLEEQRRREQAERARQEEQQRREQAEQDQRRREQQAEMENQRRMEQMMMTLRLQNMQSDFQPREHSTPTNNYFYGGGGGGSGGSGRSGGAALSQAHSCSCRTGCSHGNCGCRRRGRSCNASCGCVNCVN